MYVSFSNKKIIFEGKNLNKCQSPFDSISVNLALKCNTKYFKKLKAFTDYCPFDSISYDLSLKFNFNFKMNN